MNVPGIPLELFPAIYHSLPHPVWLARADGFMESANTKALEYLGLRTDEIRGWNWLQAVHPVDREEALHAWLEATTLGHPFETSFRIMTASGQFRWNAVCACPIADGTGKVAAYVVSCTDTDDWKQSLRNLSSANREIEELEALLRLLETKTSIGFGYLDSELRYTRVNDTLAAINGLPAAEHKGKRVRDVVPKLWPVVRPFFEKVISAKVPILDTEAAGETPAAPGANRRWSVSYFPVVHAGEFLGVAFIVAERRAEEIVAQSSCDQPEVEGRCIREVSVEQLAS